MKKILFFAATALLFAACSNEEGTAPEVAQAPQAVAFDTYVPNATRAGDAGVMTTTTLQEKGFGVFAWQGAITPGYANAAPNFMYNQEITYPSGAWTYTPLKYWPNETGNDSQSPYSAASTDIEGLSFLAYAPYVSSASGSYGITGMSTNASAPSLDYTIALDPANSVDLLWGVAPSGGFSYTNVQGGTSSVAEGMPLLNLLKPSKDQKIKFLFKHALARLGVTIVAAVDQIPAGGKLDDNTKIFVNSIKIEDANLPITGSLDLNNTTAGVAKWSNQSGSLSLTIDNGELNPDIQNATGSKGVTTTEKNAIKDGNYFMLIPTHGTNATFTVSIDYDVITTDPSVSAGSVTTNNKIHTTVVAGDPTDGFTNNKAFNLKIILGLTSVKLDAEVADWEIAGSTDVNLPKNM